MKKKILSDIFILLGFLYEETYPILTAELQWRKLISIDPRTAFLRRIRENVMIPKNIGDDSKLHICMVSQTFYPFVNGLSSYIMDLSRALIQRGHSISGVHLRPPDFQPEETVNGIKVYRVPSGAKFNYRNFKEFRDSMFACCFESCTHNLREPETNKGFIEYQRFNEACAKKIEEIDKRQPLSCIHLHDPQVFMVPKFLNIDIPKVITWHINLPKELPSTWSDFFLNNLERFDRCIFPSIQHILNAQKLGISEKKLGLIIPFIDTGLFHPGINGGDFKQRWGIKKNEHLIICVGRLDPMKGQNYIIEAMPSIIRSFPQTKLCLIGNGSMTNKIFGGTTIWKKELLKMLRYRNLEEHVIFTGCIPRTELPRAYTSADITVLPSIKECFGLCISESFGCETPVIASAVGGIPTQIDHNINGFLVKSHCFKSISKTVKHLFHNERLRRMMGVQGRKKVIRNFSSKRGAKDYERIYLQK